MLKLHGSLQHLSVRHMYNLRNYRNGNYSGRHNMYMKATQDFYRFTVTSALHNAQHRVRSREEVDQVLIHPTYGFIRSPQCAYHVFCPVLQDFPPPGSDPVQLSVIASVLIPYFLTLPAGHWSGFVIVPPLYFLRMGNRGCTSGC